MEIEIIKALQSTSSPFLDGFFRAVTYLGSVFAVLFVILLMFLICNKKYTIFMAICFGVSWGINEIAKLIIKRPRPFTVSTEIIQMVNANNFSMPSGHSFTVAFLACMVLYYIFTHCKNKSVKIITTIGVISAALLVGLSRMYLGVHYLSDVLVGFTFGALSAIMSVILFNFLIKKQKEKYGNQSNIKQ